MKLTSISTQDAIRGYSDSKIAKSEKSDCVVRAIASAYELEYDRAHKWVAITFGRQNGKGTRGFLQGMNSMSDSGKRLNRKLCRKISESHLTTNGGKSKMTVGTFVKQYDRGTYIIVVTGHAFTIKSGAVIGNREDSDKIKKIVKAAWKIG